MSKFVQVMVWHRTGKNTIWTNDGPVYVFVTLRPRQNGRHFPDDRFKWIFLNENVWISIAVSLKFVPKGPINNIPALVQIMAWRRPGDKPLSEPMMVSIPTHICVTPPQWVKPQKGLAGWQTSGRSKRKTFFLTINKLQWNINRNEHTFIQENAFENVVWKMAAICLGLNE